MNFPMESPVFQFIYWALNTPGVAAVIVLGILLGAVSTFGLTLRWIATAKNELEKSHPYPSHPAP